MSIENSSRALIITIIRGLLPVVCFAIVPIWLSHRGIWLSVPIAEILSTLVIVGAGATGVEIAGAISEMKRYVVPKDYPDLEASDINI